MKLAIVKSSQNMTAIQYEFDLMIALSIILYL